MTPTSTIEADLQQAERLREARIKARLSQGAVADHLGLSSEKTVWRWERAKTKGWLDHADALAELYGTTVEWLTGGTSERTEALQHEIADMRSLLQDPQRLREAADALMAEEEVQ